MNPQKVVTPVKTGVKAVYTFLNFLDSGFRKGTKEKFLTKFIQNRSFYYFGRFRGKLQRKMDSSSVDDFPGFYADSGIHRRWIGRIAIYRRKGRTQRAPEFWGLEAFAVFGSEMEAQLKMDPAITMTQPTQRESPALTPRYRQLTMVEKRGVR